MPFCTKCGNEIAENVNFCQKCGNATQGGHTNTTSTTNTAGTIGNDDNPALWNPKAAALWGILCPPLALFLHYLNWKALGKDKEEKQTKSHFILYIVLLLFYILVLTLNAYGTRSNWVASIGSTIFLIWIAFYLPFWYWGLVFFNRSVSALAAGKEVKVYGKMQTEYIKENYGTEYKRKSWKIPIATLSGFWVIFIVIFNFYIVDAGTIILAKKRPMEGCPRYTTEEVINSVITSPEWKAPEGGGDDTWFVSVSGPVSKAFDNEFPFEIDNIEITFLESANGREDIFITVNDEDASRNAKTSYIKRMCKIAKTAK